jgi:rhodanese-related sulfurtransferase
MRRVATALAVVLIGTLIGCTGAPATVLEELVESRRLAADVLVQFTKAADAGNRAVMADTDEASIAYAREADQAIAAVQKNRDALKPLLTTLGYSDESSLLEEFDRGFAEYLKLDRTILQLAVENTNLKAQRLSFGEAQQSADAFRDALSLVASRNPADEWHARALVAAAVAGVREIQALEAPHIAEADDAAMTGLEARMTAIEATVQKALGDLAPLIRPQSRSSLTAATTALNEFKHVNAQILELSRRNSNVRSLALSLGQKRTLTAACEASLRSLEAALAKRGFVATR